MCYSLIPQPCLAHIAEMKGKTHSYWSPVALSELTEDNVLRAFEWHDKVLTTGGSVKDSGYLLFELKCMVCTIPLPTLA